LKLAFFTWTASLGKILTLDNLPKRHIIVIDWCCMCKKCGKTQDHLFLHCDVAREMWIMIFHMFGVEWIMPKRVVHFLPCWNRGVGWNDSIIVWNAIPSLLWCIWRERSARNFNVQGRRVRIYGHVFSKPYLSGPFLALYPVSLAMQIFVFFFLVLDLLGVFSCIFSLYLGCAPCASNEFPLLIENKSTMAKGKCTLSCYQIYVL
jgi:hypothetical protein